MRAVRAQGREPPGAWVTRPPTAGYRTWVVLSLRVLLEAETGEIGGTRNVGGGRRP
jgi:hypothetical protein